MTDEHEPRETTGDALSWFLREFPRDDSGGRAFGSGEHVWLGNEGLSVACRELKEDPLRYIRIARANGVDELSYGEIVALSGDFYRTPDELFDGAATSSPWFWQRDNFPKLRATLARELEWIAGSEVGYPDHNLAYWWSAKSYVELALANDAHFGWHNVLTYCKYHEIALGLADEARRTGDRALWRRALYTNGFADHFLTDAFAAGHIRVPRSQTRAWALGTARSDKQAGVLSKLLHDQDGHVHTIHGEGRHPREAEGLRVTNSRNEDWFTRCDGQLFIGKLDDPAIRGPVAAVAASLTELIGAHRRGERPQGIFDALSYVPFPHPAIPTLCQKFSPTMDPQRLDQIVASLEWYAEIPWLDSHVAKADVVDYFAALPAIMRQFREDVAATDDPALARMPAAYREAFAQLS